MRESMEKFLETFFLFSQIMAYQKINMVGHGRSIVEYTEIEQSYICERMARMFEEKHKDTDWLDKDYMEEIDKFFEENILDNL